MGKGGGRVAGKNRRGGGHCLKAKNVLTFLREGGNRRKKHTRAGGTRAEKAGVHQKKKMVGLRLSRRGPGKNKGTMESKSCQRFTESGERGSGPGRGSAGTFAGSPEGVARLWVEKGGGGGAVKAGHPILKKSWRVPSRRGPVVGKRSDKKTWRGGTMTAHVQAGARTGKGPVG